ncbi:MAG: hypothetical protein V7L23_15450 [Nostoc sp.]|uniref:hypothetical protein n=1 Tax=Nostoc sp. TaxID=1180 RepID=UPI002FF3F664
MSSGNVNPRQQKWDFISNALISEGIDSSIFENSSFTKADGRYLAYCNQQGDGEIPTVLLGDLGVYIENVLKVTSKKVLGPEYKIRSREALSGWSKTCGIPPRVGTNQTKFPQLKLTEKKVSILNTGYGDGTVVRLDLAVRLISHAVRFRLGLEQYHKISLEDYESISRHLLVHFLDSSTSSTKIFILGERYGKPSIRAA